MIKAGLLGLYLELYDRAIPEMRPRIEGFYNTIASELRNRGVQVLTSDICRVAVEVRQAVESFECGGADAVVTLHLAYSPSLESVDALASSILPVIVLDTTPTYDYGPSQDPEELLYNHGIHGVQDLCSLLARRGKTYRVVAGHWEKSDVLDTVAGWLKAASMASLLRNSRVGLIGNPFPGMGDFAVNFAELESKMGIKVIKASQAVFESLLPAAESAEVTEEIEWDKKHYTLDFDDEAAHVRTAQSCIAVRRWIEREGLSAFTMNFADIDRSSGLPCVPFLEASKGMSRSIGYAGEGDVLTAAVGGVLAKAFGGVTFTEMFCPDWAGESILMSHMGEVNPDLLAAKPVLKKMDYKWGDNDDPVVAVGALKPGPVTLVNAVPTKSGGFALIAASDLEVLAVEGEDRSKESIHGWIRPALGVAGFLEAYSYAGGSHHLSLVYGDALDQVARFGELLGWDVVRI